MGRIRCGNSGAIAVLRNARKKRFRLSCVFRILTYWGLARYRRLYYDLQSNSFRFAISANRVQIGHVKIHYTPTVLRGGAMAHGNRPAYL